MALRINRQSDHERGWFLKARFGMFIHFGLYALRGGNENDCTCDILPKAKYERLMHRFNPCRFDAGEWAELAITGGARYVVLTAKHGEGFCLWDSRWTAYKITNTPFGRDLLAELAPACRKKGLRFGVYYSFLDMHYKEPGEGLAASRTYPGYVEAQIQELLTSYGRIDQVWFDPPDERITSGFLVRLSDWIHEVQPSCVINERGLGVHTPNPRADYVSPERYIPEIHADRHSPVECCDSMGQLSWGYHNEEQFWSTPELIRRLSRVVAFEGNYLLNVQPAADGRIRPECVERLQAISRWLKVNREAIYDTQTCLLTPREGFPAVLHDLHVWDDLPVIGLATQRKNTIYLHLHSWPMGDSLLVQHLTGNVRQVKLLGSRLRLAAYYGPIRRLGTRTTMKGKWGQKGIIIRGLPAEPPGTAVQVIKLVMKTGWKIDRAAIRRERTRLLDVLPGEAVRLEPQTSEQQAANGVSMLHHFKGSDGRARFCWFGRPDQRIIWHLNVAERGEYCVLVESEKIKGAALSVKVAGQTLALRFNETENKIGRQAAGKVRLPAGRQTLAVNLRALAAGRHYLPMITGIVLCPVN